jgi:serine/threonine protein kinase/tetratricopeptide (TPR) repeat protein
MLCVIGTLVARYRIVDRLGAGATSDVYRAEDLRLRRYVALKVLRADRRNHDIDALFAEARAASALTHPNIAVVYEVDRIEIDGQPVDFIAMELVAGRTLADLIAGRALTIDQSLDVARQAAEGLAAAHAHGLVHRDIKPANLMVTESGLVKVLDFGLARTPRPAIAPEDAITRTGESITTALDLAGTLPYMAPEQVRGEELDGRADMFSLGVVVYELFCGRRPFAHDNPAVLLEALLRDDPPSFTPRFDDPRARRVDPIVRRMLAKDRAQRFATLDEVAAALIAVARGDQPLVTAPAPERLAVAAFINITANSEDDWLGTGMAESLSTDLGQLGSLVTIPRPRVHELTRMLAQDPEVRGDALVERVARELDARWIVSGGFQRAGPQVRVTAVVTDVANGQVAGSVKVDGRLDDIFALQDRLARDVFVVLRSVTRPSGVGEVSAQDTGVVGAYEAFSKGVVNLRTESYESLDRAALLFERAVALDPRYARAHIELGAVHSTKADYLPMSELRDRAVASLRRGLDLQPDSVRAWREMGIVLMGQGREAEGVAAIRRALAIDPEDAGALGTMARALFVGLARFKDAAAYFERALERNPKGGWYALQLAHCLALVRDFARGEASAERAVSLQESFLSGQEGVLIVGAWMRLGHLAALQDRHQAAVDYFLREIEFLARVDHALRNRILVELNARLGASYLRLGQDRKAQSAFDIALEGFDRRVRLGADDPFTRFYAAGVFALRRDVETTLAFLERAAAERRAFTVERARIEPEFDAIRADARFERLVSTPPTGT